MPHFYYKEEIVVGDDGEKFGMLVIDSCLLLCSEKIGQLDFQSLGQEMSDIFKMTCELNAMGKSYKRESAQMMKWIDETMKEWDKDPKVIWRASVQHHPIYGKMYKDIQHIIDNYLPLLVEHKFDLYLNGHEHILEYAYHPYENLNLHPMFA